MTRILAPVAGKPSGRVTLSCQNKEREILNVKTVFNKAHYIGSDEAKTNVVGRQEMLFT